MSTTAIILLIIAALIIILLLRVVFAGNHYRIERSIHINKPKQEVFDYLRLMKNQEHYNKWVMTDPNSRKTYTGADGTVGCILQWDSDMKSVGKGEQEITGLRPYEQIDYQVRFIKPFENRSDIHLITTGTGTTTNVSWVFEGNRSFGMKLMHVLLNLEAVLGKDMDTSLGNLKRVLENKA